MKSELEMLREQIREIELKQARCNHKWGEVEYDPTVKREYNIGLSFQGSDMYCCYTGSGYDVKVDRWSRTCSKCGKKEYTTEVVEEQVVVKTIKKPRFR